MKESMSNDHWKAYRATSYWVKDRDQHFSIRIGEASEDLEQLLTAHDSTNWAYITASNPRSEMLTAEENAARNDQLMDHVKQAGRLYFRGEGIGNDPTWPPEASILIVGMDKDEALELGREFGQNAIVIGRKGQAAELVDC